MPWSAITTWLLVSHTFVAGSMMHTVAGTSSGPPVCLRANPSVPKILLNVSVPPAMSDAVSGLASGGGGASTVTVMVADVVRFNTSVA